MDKVSISRFTEKVIEQHGGDKAEAILIIAVDGHNITTSAIGPDPMFINDKAIALVGATRTILNEKFKFANTMYDHLQQHGRIRTEIQEKIVDTPMESFKADNPREQPKTEKRPEKEIAQEFVDGLINLLERTLGGSMNANDD